MIRRWGRASCYDLDGEPGLKPPEKGSAYRSVKALRHPKIDLLANCFIPYLAWGSKVRIRNRDGRQKRRTGTWRENMPMVPM